jgi:glycerol uptake operon antiterminator
MSVQSRRSMVKLLARYKVVPVVENRIQLQHVLKTSACRVIVLRHSNLLELAPLLVQAYQRQYAVYVNIDHAEGIHPDAAGLQYLARQLCIAGVISANPRVLAIAKMHSLETVLRIFAADSTGLESALETFDPTYIDLLDISPALAIPYISPPLTSVLPLPFIGSGLISTGEQVQAVLNAGAIGVTLTQSDFGVDARASVS